MRRKPVAGSIVAALLLALSACAGADAVDDPSLITRKCPDGYEEAGKEYQGTRGAPEIVREAERAENCGERALPEVNALFITINDAEPWGGTCRLENYSGDLEPLSETGYSDVPNATFVVRDGRNNVIGRLQPDDMPDALADLNQLLDACSFIYTGEFDLADVMIIEGSRMQDGGFPVWKEDTYDLYGMTVLAELSIG